MAKKKLTEEMVDLIANALEERKPGVDRRNNRVADQNVGNTNTNAKAKENRRKGKDRRNSED